MRLFDLSDSVLALESDLDREDLADDTRDALMDAWLEAQGHVIEKLDHYAAWIKCIQDQAEGRRAQAKRMQEQIDRLRKLAEADENRAAKAEERMTQFFERHKHQKIKTARFDLTYQAVGGVRALIIDVPVEKLQAKFQKQIPATIEADKDALREALAAGEKQRDQIARMHRALHQAYSANKITKQEYEDSTDLILNVPTGWEELEGARLAPKKFTVRIR